jgi:hypothetical protein
MLKNMVEQDTLQVMERLQNNGCNMAAIADVIRDPNNRETKKGMRSQATCNITPHTMYVSTNIEAR